MQVFDAAPDRAARNLGRACCRRHTAMTSADGFRHRVEPTAALIQRRSDGLMADTNGYSVDHGPTIGGAAHAENRPYPASTAIRLFLGVALPEAHLPGPKPAGKAHAPDRPLGGPPLGLPAGPEDLLLEPDGSPVRLDHAFSWEAPLAAHGMMQMAIANADPVTGQAAWYDLRVRLERCEAGPTEPQFPALDGLLRITTAADASR